MKLATIVLLAVQFLGSAAGAQASESGAKPAPPAATQANSLPAVRQVLREFDRFLDHHPTLEDELRLDPRLVFAGPIWEKNAELRDFLGANSGVAEALKVFPHYLIYRALLRQSSIPLTFGELGSFRDAFQQDPKLEKTLSQNPELVRDPVFVASHPALKNMLIRNSTLRRAFGASTVSQDSK